MTDFSDRIKSLMEMRGVNQAEFAAMIDATPAAISQYTTGNRVPQTEVLMRICEKFKVSSDWLLGLEKRKPDTGVIGYFFCRNCDTRFKIMGMEKK